MELLTAQLCGPATKPVPVWPALHQRVVPSLRQTPQGLLPQCPAE
jgi:hypothetical protein